MSVEFRSISLQTMYRGTNLISFYSWAMVLTSALYKFMAGHELVIRNVAVVIYHLAQIT